MLGPTKNEDMTLSQKRTEHIPEGSLRPPKGAGVSVKHFILREVLGSGHSGSVRRAEIIKGTLASKTIPSVEVALKVVDRKGLHARARHFLNREIMIHSNLQHPNIATVYAAFEDANSIYLAIELLQGSDLYTVLKELGHGLSELNALLLIAQVLKPVSHMHALGFAHRDIKPENLVFAEKPDSSNIGAGKLALIDFGEACARDPNSLPDSRSSSEKCGTLRYSAPEIMAGNKYFPELCDIWSIGVVLYTVIARRTPYGGKDHDEVLHKIMNKKLSFDAPEWAPVSEDTVGLIRRMLSLNAMDRPSAAKSLGVTMSIIQTLW